MNQRFSMSINNPSGSWAAVVGLLAPALFALGLLVVSSRATPPEDATTPALPSQNSHRPTAGPTESPAWENPVIAGHGKVVPVPGGREGPRAGSKILVDLTTGAQKAQVNAGLGKIARFVNLYAAGGIPSQGQARRAQARRAQAGVRFVVVVHGEAVSCVLNTRENQANKRLIQTLSQAGVEFLICGQALRHKGHSPDQVVPEVKLAYSALTASVNRQADGYAYVPLK